VSGALAGRVALVTGVSRRVGIGFGVARRLAADGADLVVSSWAAHDAEMPWGADPDGPEALAAELRAISRRVEHLPADLEDPTAPEELLVAAQEAFGHVDVVVANHARSSDQGLSSLTAEEIDRTLAANVRGTLLLIQAWAAQHDGRPGGRVVLFTSGQHRGPMPDELPYVASKGALHQLTASLAAGLADRGITVNCVNPGPTDTGYADQAARAEVVRRMPVGRWGTPDDVARLVARLVSDEGAWVTGAVIDSDGGFRYG
jgi:3-oxoacyl-[acyl-carrier protein] reductase